jgi:Domain of unknown function (DUF4157)
MALRSHAHQKDSSYTASTTVQHTSRPFAPQTKPEAEQTQTLPELQTQVETAQRFGHHLADFNLSSHPSSPPPIQPKLAIGAPGDKYEQEADRVAQQVVQRLNAPQVGGPGPEAFVQRQTPEDEELQMKPMLQMRGNARTGGQASSELESAINQARGGGQSLDAGLQRSMGQAMGANFSRVRVHTDDRANQLNRSIQAKAFTTGQNVFFRQGAYQPESRGGQELLAHELTHVVQQGAASRLNTAQRSEDKEASDITANNQPHISMSQAENTQLIQRAVGYEFQTNWGVIEKLPEKEFVKNPESGLKGMLPKHKSKRRSYDSKQTLHQYDGFKMTTDAANTDLGSEIEWVVEPPIEESSGVAAVNGVMGRLKNTVAQLVAHQGRDKFTLDEVTGAPGDSGIELHPKIKGGSAGAGMKANPQITGGVRLDQMANMFAQLGNPRADEPHHQVREELMGMGGADILANSAAAANQIQGSASLKGLAAQIIAYLQAGAIPPALRGRPGQAFQYAKLIGKILARTDFGAQFKLLPEDERQRFEENPESFANLILGAAKVGDGNTNVFERKIKNVPFKTDQGTFDFPVTRNEWLTQITQGQDLLTQRIFVLQKPDDADLAYQLDSMGRLEDKTDEVGRNNDIPAPIVEFRQVKAQMPYTDWGPFAASAFEYLKYLNQQQGKG